MILLTITLLTLTFLSLSLLPWFLYDSTYIAPSPLCRSPSSRSFPSSALNIFFTSFPPYTSFGTYALPFHAKFLVLFLTSNLKPGLR